MGIGATMSGFTEINIGFKDFKNYFFSDIPFARYIHDKSVVENISSFDGIIVEIGASNHDYSEFTKSRDYKKINLSKINENIILMDARNLDFEDNSIDYFVCFSVLEHIYEYEKVINEVYRCLKPNGTFLLITPWLFPYHGAPDDYFRFSKSSLKIILKKFKTTEIKSVGNYWINLAFILQKPEWNRKGKPLKKNLGSFFRKILGIMFLIFAKFKNYGDDDYVMLYTSISRK